jgi:outer membrane protein assembly factor BamB
MTRRPTPRSPHRPAVRLAGLALAAALPGAALAEDAAHAGRDWPQFRGAERSGRAAAGDLARSWPESGPRVAWRRPLGPGFSGVSVAAGGAYVLFGAGDKEFAARLDPATGAEVWRAEIGPLFEEQFGNGPRSTPAVAGGRVYAFSSTGFLHALDAATGGKLWSIDAKEHGARVPMRGFCPSPLVEGDLVVLEVGAGPGKGVLALDQATGAVRWSARDTPGGYSSPIAVTIDGVHQLVFVHTAGREIVSLLPDGAIHWTHPWEPGAIAMPVFVPPNRILVSASADVGALMLEVGRGDDGKPRVAEVWRSRLLKNHFSSSVHVDGYIYGFDMGTLRCLDAATGESKWAHRGLGVGSLIAADGLLFVLGDRGRLVLVEATPEQYRELGSLQVFESRTWTAPALADGRLYLRDHEELVCVEVGHG